MPHPSVQPLVAVLSAFSCLREASEVQLCAEIECDLTLPEQDLKAFLCDSFGWCVSLTALVIITSPILGSHSLLKSIFQQTSSLFSLPRWCLGKGVSYSPVAVGKCPCSACSPLRVCLSLIQQVSSGLVSGHLMLDLWRNEQRSIQGQAFCQMLLIIEYKG